MTAQVSYFELGASLYTPCSHANLQEVIQHGMAGVRSMVFCLEDAVRDEDVNDAFNNLSQALQLLVPESNFKRFVRPRSPQMLGELLQLPHIQKIDGFVLPKVDLNSLPLFRAVLHNHAGKSYTLMPTLETDQVFDPAALRNIRTALQDLSHNIPCVRIGGNDLMNLLGLKRMPGRTVYETPLRTVIDQLMVTFRPYGFELSAPVFDFIDDTHTLQRELETDISYGLFAKTAIHPTQVSIIENAYSSFARTHTDQANVVLDQKSAAVFKQNGQMMERTCHHNWALRILSLTGC